MQLETYLQRIGHRRSVRPDLETLIALHRAHLLSIPYENLDIHLGRELTLDLEQIYQKMVIDKRGGWCFEMNGLFAWVLEQIGFQVRRISTHVHTHGHWMTEGDHIALLVKAKTPTTGWWLADVGFGNGLLEPIRLETGAHNQGWLKFHLELTGKRWKFINHPASADAFEFTNEFSSPALKLEHFRPRCHWLQSSTESGFVRQNVCQIFTAEGILTLRGAVLSTTNANGQHSQHLSSANEFASTLRERFKLDILGIERLWPQIWQRHQSWQASLHHPTEQNL